MPVMPSPLDKPAVGVVVVTHEGAAGPLVSAARAVLGGDLHGVVAVPCPMADKYPVLVEKIANGCQMVDEGSGVLLLVDVYGSSPFHASMSLLDGNREAEVLCGVNLPMLLKLGTLDRTRLAPVAIAEILRDTGRRAIRLGTELTGRGALSEKLP